MGKKSKKEKKNTITFRLVSRSQQDPLINYDDAPQSVLIEEKSSKDRKAEQRKYGIYYDDDYDYLQHLKGCEEVDENYYFEEFDPKGTRVKEIKSKKEIENECIIKLPSSVFSSEYQESVGMLNKGILSKGIKPDWDQDIVETLCDDYVEDKDNLLDDDFLIQAMGDEIKPNNNSEDDDLDYWEANKVKFDDDKTCESDDRHTVRTVGNKTEFTNYSLTSSIIKRNEKLNDLDEHFESFFLRDIAEEQENESQDSDEEDNELEKKILSQLANESKVEKSKPNFHTDLHKKKIIEIAEQQLINEEKNQDLEEIELRLATGKNDFEQRWDCESILSNFSNTYYKPKVIFEQRSNKIQINKKTGVPEGGNKLTEKNLKQLNKQDDEKTIKSIASIISQLSIRNKNETTDEKKLRKRELKEYMRDRRQEKKANKLAFKQEHLKLNNSKVVNRQLTAIKYN